MTIGNFKAINGYSFSMTIDAEDEMLICHLKDLEWITVEAL